MRGFDAAIGVFHQHAGMAEIILVGLVADFDSLPDLFEFFHQRFIETIFQLQRCVG